MSDPVLFIIELLLKQQSLIPSSSNTDTLGWQQTRATTTIFSINLLVRWEMLTSVSQSPIWRPLMSWFVQKSKINSWLSLRR